MFARCGLKVERLEGINGSVNPGWKILNPLTLYRFEDVQFQQYAVVARKEK